MRSIKKMLGFVWILLGPATVVFMAWQAWDKISQAPAGIDQTNTALQWGIILLVFIPIALGLVIFGKYALGGEYDELTEGSDKI